MSITGLLFLLVAQFFAGRGLLYLFNIKQKLPATSVLSMINGIMVVSLIPFLLELLHIPITQTSVVIGILVAAIAINITQVKKYDFNIFKSQAWWKRITIFDWFFLIFFFLILSPSLWRGFYFPPYARDVLSGAEILADFTVLEKTMINSVFSLNLESTNNHLKPPFILDLQIVYKLLVYPFGQLWLGTMVICFLTWLYTLLKEKLHPVLAGLCLLLFVAIPEMYGYTYIILFDYPNAVLFAVAVYFLAQYAIHKQANHFFFSVLMFGFATFIRSETPVLIYMFLPLIWFLFYKNKMAIGKAALYTAIYGAVPFFFYYIWMGVFVKHYMPVTFDVSSQINTNLSDLSPFFNRLEELTTTYMFGSENAIYYANFIDFFCLLLLCDIIFFRKAFAIEGVVMLYGILVVYMGMPVLGYIIPWFDLDNTTKRGIFKLFPLMLLYMRNSGSLLRLSAVLTQWQDAVPAPAQTKTTSKATVSASKTPPKKKK